MTIATVLVLSVAGARLRRSKADCCPSARPAGTARCASAPRPPRICPTIAIAVGPDADKDEVDQIAKATGGSDHLVTDPSEIHSVILKAIVQAGSGS
jgi:hypothetical protein